MIIQSHRGFFSGKNPENSIEAVELSLKEGFSVEVDVRLTKDNICVLSHDADTSRVYPKKENKIMLQSHFSEVSFLCTLDNFLGLLHKYRVQNNAVHIKNINEPKILDQVCELIISKKLTDYCFLFTNDEQSISLIKYCKMKFPQIKLAVHISYENHRSLEDLSLANFVWLDESKNHQGWISKEIILHFHSIEKKVFVISPEITNSSIKSKDIKKIWNNWVRWEVDCICTDKVKELFAFLKK